ncbi:hypothetical protein T190607A02C_70152 [Tenacibaculum sp. 190524A02b]
MYYKYNVLNEELRQRNKRRNQNAICECRRQRRFIRVFGN